VKDNRFYVYQIIDPRDNKILYIGKGTGGRCYQHFVITEKHPINELKELLFNILETTEYTQFDFIVPIKCKISHSEAHKLELDTINRLGYENLYNKKPGHEIGKDVSNSWSNERRENQRERLISINKSDKKREQLKITRTGIKRPEMSNENHPRAKTRLQYDLHGNLIREWKTAKEAAIALNISANMIGACCSGNKKSAGGFIWKYKN
jgi:hypothetical protein